MIMKLTERSFSTQLIRPRPAFHLNGDQKLIAVFTEWGNTSINSKTLFEELESRYHFLSSDKDSTQSFPQLISLNFVENNMRTSLLQTNQMLFKKINSEEYRSGFELFFAATEDHICTVVQIGQPMILIDRPNHILHYVGSSADRWSFSYSQHSDSYPQQNPLSPEENTTLKNQTSIPPPLPGQLLGIYEDIVIQPFRFRWSMGDRLILLSRHHIPSLWFQTKRKDRNLKTLSELAVKDNPDIPFWIGMIEFND